MRLVRTKTLTLHEFHGSRIPAYAVLSHRWEEGEVSFQNVRDQERNAKNANGWAKLRNLCDRARQDRWEYVWNDTCCIDKSSSAELTEAVNSMFRWYQNSRECYAYLKDVPSGLSDADKNEKIRESEWFDRGWTLQELIAPDHVTFISQGWKEILGTRDSLKSLISSITGIDDVSNIDMSAESVATKMSWASDRVCERPEDYAYCLMGLFGVNMPLLYGEGRYAAFFRLQLEIMKISDDESIFAWFDDMYPRIHGGKRGLLASSADDFKYSKDVNSFVFDTGRPPYSYTHMGLQFEPKIIHRDRFRVSGLITERTDIMVPLNCYCGTEKRPLVILLRRSGRKDNQYCRVVTGIKEGLGLGPEALAENSMLPVTTELDRKLSDRDLPMALEPQLYEAMSDTRAEWFSVEMSPLSRGSSEQETKPNYSWLVSSWPRQLIYVRDPSGFHHKLDGEDEIFESDDDDDDDDNDEINEMADEDSQEMH